MNAGQPGKPITFKAYPGETPILHASIGVRPGLPNTDYVTIDGFTVDGEEINIHGFDPTVRVTGVLVQNNTVSGLYNPVNDNIDGIRVDNTSYTTVRNNRVSNVHNVVHNPNAAGIKLYNNDHAVVENNEIFDTDVAIHDKQAGEFNTYRRNLIHDCHGGNDAILFQNGVAGFMVQGNQVYENIFYNCLRGIGFWSGAGAPINTTSIYNNTFDTTAAGAFHTPGNGSNERFWNNIVSRPTAASGNDVGTYDDPPVSIGLADYNLFAVQPRILVGLYLTNRQFTTLSSWQSYSGKDTHSMVGTPLFVNQANRNYHLQPGSPALGTGRVGGVSTGAAVNMGAYTTGTEVIGPIGP